MAKFNWKNTNELLQEIKNKKKKELNQVCHQEITKGFLVELKDTEYRFSYGLENQQNFTDTMRLFDNNMIDTIGWNAYVNEEKVRINLTESEFKEVYLAGVKHRVNAMTRLNDVLYPFVEKAENKETIARIYWDTDLPTDEISLKEGKTVKEQFKELSKKDDELTQSDMTLMMGLVQVTNLFGGK